MKRIIYLLAGAACLLTLANSCSDDMQYALDGEGSVNVRTSLSSDLKVVSRSDADALRSQYGESLLLWITKVGAGPVRKYNGVDALPTAPVVLPNGSYVAEAWAGDSVGASFDAKYFKAHVPFEVTTGNSSNVDVNLTIANSVVALDYADDIEEYLRGDFTMTVGHSRASLDYVNRESRDGYFMLPSADTDLTLTLKGTDNAGRAYEQTEVIANVKPAVKYVVHITGKGQMSAIGGALFTLEIDYTEIEETENIPITLAPEIDGVGFDISQVQSGEEGNLGRYSVYITAVDELASVVIDSDDLNDSFGWRNIDLLTGEASYISQLTAAGITTKEVVNAETGKLTNLRINFEREWTDPLSEGQHKYVIRAVDDGGRTSVATLTLDVTNAPVVLQDVSDPGYDSATLRASIVKAQDGATGSFFYRVTGASNWTEVAATINGTEMTADLTGLSLYTPYQYKAKYAGTEVLTVKEFTTLDGWQLPNADFESWTTITLKSNKSALVPDGTIGDKRFWDSGNHGSTTLSASALVCKQDATYKHGGRYAVKMESMFVGAGILGKFAAGNVFSGEYLATEGMDGVLGWGQPFSFAHRPKSLSGYAHYDQGTVDYSGTGATLQKGDLDKGVVHFALLSADKNVQGDASYPDYPVVIRTASSNQQLFDPTASNVIAYGKYVFDAPFGGTGMAPFTVTLVDVHPDQEVAYIVVVGSSSIEGDYFTGSKSSALWLDDLHIDY